MPGEETSSSVVSDRRPIAARSWGVSRALTGVLVGIGLSPNQVSVLGMLSGVLAGVAYWGTAHWEHPRVLWIVGAALIQLRLLANMLDGMVAVETGKTSHLGELYNDVPDRVSDACTLIGLGYAVGGSPVLGFTAALLAVLTAYIRAVGKAAGAGSEFCGPMAKQQRMFLATVAGVYMAATPQGWQFAWGPDGAWGVGTAVLAVIGAGSLYTCGRRLVRIGQKLRGKA